MKRAKKTTKCANPLFEQWLDEWRQEALARDSPIAHSFRKALASLRKYPLPLARGRDCLILQNFGQKLCSMLDKKLEQHKKLTDSPQLETAAVAEKRKKVHDGEDEINNRGNSSSEKGADFDAIVLSDENDSNDNDDVMFNAHHDGLVDRHEITPLKPTRSIDLARKERTESTESSSSTEAFQRFCENNAEPIITVQNKMQHFIFTESIEQRLITTSNINKIDERVVHNQELETVEPKKKRGRGPKAASQKDKDAAVEEAYESFFLLPNNFDIILLVDTQETSGGKTRPQDDQTIAELSETGILFEVRSLKIGDFTWIARCRFTNKELVLPYIVERKRIDDLSASIVDGRYKEQKFRLKQSGIQNIIYMVENYGKNYYGSIPLSSLLQASVNSLIQDNFTVKYTYNHKDSMRYLATMTNIISKIYESKELTSCKKKDIDMKDLSIVSCSNCLLMEFTEFNKAAKKTKNFKVREMFMRQLLQLKGISVDKAIAITNIYATPKVLHNAFKNGDENLLAKIPFGTSTSKIGPAISKTLHQFYTRYSFN